MSVAFASLLEPFIEFPFMRRALVATLALSLGCAPIGCVLVLRRMSLVGDAMAHAVLPGAAAGFLLAGLSLPAMSLGGFVAALAVALAAGFVTRSTPQREDASFAAFESPLIEAVAVFFMVLAGVNFALYFMVWRKRSLAVLWRDLETRWFFGVMAGAVGLVALFLTAHGVYPSFGESLRHAAFSVVSIATTTGFATVDYAQWPTFAPALMLFLCCFATCAGSTGGGIKMARVLLLAKAARSELIRIVHPRAVTPVTLGGAAVDARVLQSVLAFMLIYGAVVVAATLVLLLSGLDMVTAFTAVLASINNTGPGLGEVGPAANYQGLSDAQTWVCSIVMLLGRLELLSVLVLLTPSFWRR
jgi:trk system potassium uptake protein TrkH